MLVYKDFENYGDGVYKCTYDLETYYVKINRQSKFLEKEYKNYKRLDDQCKELRSLFVDTPFYHKDHDYITLVFKSNDDWMTLCQILFKSITEFFVVLPLAIRLILTINTFDITHCDAHMSNILFNYKTKKIKFIDVESISFETDDKIQRYKTSTEFYKRYKYMIDNKYSLQLQSDHRDIYEYMQLYEGIDTIFSSDADESTMEILLMELLKTNDKTRSCIIPLPHEEPFQINI